MKRVDLQLVQDLYDLGRNDSIAEYYVPDMIAELKALREVEAAARKLDASYRAGDGFYIARMELQRKLKVLDSE